MRGQGHAWGRRRRPARGGRPLVQAQRASKKDVETPAEVCIKSSPFSRGGCSRSRSQKPFIGLPPLIQAAQAAGVGFHELAPRPPHACCPDHLLSTTANEQCLRGLPFLDDGGRQGQGLVNAITQKREFCIRHCHPLAFRNFPSIRWSGQRAN